jgi:hypothetical protein
MIKHRWYCSHNKFTLPITSFWHCAYRRVCFIRYSWQALMLNQFDQTDPTYVGDDATVLEYYGLDGATAWGSAFVLLIFFGVFSVFALLALQFVDHNRR